MSLIPTRQSEALRRVLESYGLDLHTAMPGMFRSYNASEQTGDVLIGVRRVNPGQGDDDPDETEAFPILPAVPVVWPFSGGYFSHLPISVGDGCLLVFCEADINAWRGANGQAVDPGVATRFGLSGAVAIPGLSWRGRKIGSADSAGARFGKDGGPQVLVTSSEVQAGGTDPLGLAAKIEAHFAKISADLITVFAAATAGTPTYSYAAEIVANPIRTTTTKGG